MTTPAKKPAVKSVRKTTAKKATVRKTTARKATAKKATARKATAKKASQASLKPGSFDVGASSSKPRAKGKPGTKVGAIYGLRKHDHYPSTTQEIMRSFTLAALKVSGFLTISEHGLVQGKAGNMGLFRAITATKLDRVWKGILLNGEYVAKAQGAMNADKGYRGKQETIAACESLIVKGGTASIKDSSGRSETITLYPVATK